MGEQPIIHRGDLIVTRENLEYAATVSEVHGYIEIAAPGITLHLLEKAHVVYVNAIFAVLPALEWAGLIDIDATYADLPALKKAGIVNIRAAHASLPELVEAREVHIYSTTTPPKLRHGTWVEAHKEANDG